MSRCSTACIGKGCGFLAAAASLLLLMAPHQILAADVVAQKPHAQKPSMPSNSPDLAAAHGVEQALLRFAAGQDLRDPQLLGTAFARDAILDFTHPGRELGVSAAPMKGREEIVQTITSVTAPIITSHTISNIRIVRLDADQAHAHALIEAMHVDRKDRSRRLLLKNSLDVVARPAGSGWEIVSLTFRNLWKQGDAAVLFPATDELSDKTAAAGNSLSAIIYQPGPAWKQGRPLSEQGLADHGQYLASLVKQGVVLSAGPLPATEGGLVIVAGPPSTARQVHDADPAVRTGKLVPIVSEWIPMMGWMSRPSAAAKGE